MAKKKFDKEVWLKEKAEREEKQLTFMVEQMIGEKKLPGLLQRALFLPKDIPMAKWSLWNKIEVLINNTADARGCKQWRDVGRWPKKGSHAFYIIGPVFFTEKQIEADPTLRGHVKYFKQIPVHRYEDTEGKELEYVAKAEEAVANMQLPLKKVADQLGYTVKTGYSWGSYGWHDRKNKEICLCGADDLTFLHELAHAVDLHLVGEENWKTGGDPLQEIVAELTACFLAQLHGMEADMGFTQAYVKMYGARENALLLQKSIKRVAAIHEYIKEVVGE